MGGLRRLGGSFPTSGTYRVFSQRGRAMLAPSISAADKAESLTAPARSAADSADIAAQLDGVPCRARARREVDTARTQARAA